MLDIFVIGIVFDNTNIEIKTMNNYPMGSVNT